jgi:hypothetical protein
MFVVESNAKRMSFIDIILVVTLTDCCNINALEKVENHIMKFL